MHARTHLLPQYIAPIAIDKSTDYSCIVTLYSYSFNVIIGTPAIMIYSLGKILMYD